MPSTCTCSVIGRLNEVPPRSSAPISRIVARPGTPFRSTFLCVNGLSIGRSSPQASARATPGSLPGVTRLAPLLALLALAVPVTAGAQDTYTVHYCQTQTGSPAATEGLTATSG